ncbi:MAG: energy transducer TonB, partial [Desulfobulbaceae bacterium]|nr:energy transducer TonB [Desulfobulbaceae bacterium]
SYAVFSEEQKQYDGALKLLGKHDTLYGADLNSMIATARIYDKQAKSEDATKAYKAVLLSGFRVPPDLKKYIKGRIALSQSM